MAKVSIDTQNRLPPRNDIEGAVRQRRVALDLEDNPTNRKVAERLRVKPQRQVDRRKLRRLITVWTGDLVTGCPAKYAAESGIPTDGRQTMQWVAMHGV